MTWRRIGWPGLLLGALALAAVGTVWAQSGGSYDASYNGFPGGGGTVSGSSYVLQNAIGQPVAGGAGGGSYSIDGGVPAGGSGGAAGPSPSPSVSPSPGPSVGPFKLFGPFVSKDGVN